MNDHHYQLPSGAASHFDFYDPDLSSDKAGCGGGNIMIIIIMGYIM